MKSRFAHVAKIVVSNILVFIMLVVLIEFFASRAVSLPSENLIESWTFNHTWKPNSSYEHREWIATNPDFPDPYVHTYNRQGWVEAYDIAEAKPNNVYRIFYLGDSFVEGTAPMSQSMPSLVEQQLNEQSKADGLTFEVINTGTASYSPLIYFVLTQHLIKSYEPDLIVVNVDMTDNFDEVKYRETAVYDASGNPTAVPPRNLYEAEFVDTPTGAVASSPLLRLQLFLWQRSYFYNWMWQTMQPFRPNTEPTDNPDLVLERWAWCEAEWDLATEADVAAMLDVLARLVTVAEKAEVKLMLTAVPHYPQFPNTNPEGGSRCASPEPHFALAAFAAELDVPYLNSYAALEPHIQATSQTEFYYYGDMHFNPRGYALWANAQLAFLRDPANQLLPSTTHNN
ncbi:MAG: hypothetical protein AAF614_28210 [Chloroflexota bacterium]